MKIYIPQRRQQQQQGRQNNLSYNNNNNIQNKNGIKVSDSVSATRNPHKSVGGGRISAIAGYVTVTKNKGKPNQEILCKNKPNLIPTTGFDAMIAKLYEASSSEGFNYVGVTANSAAPALSDSTLLGEITGGGLTRVQASTIMQVGTTSTIEISHTFDNITAQHDDVQKAALFDAVTGGNMGHIDAFDAPTTLVAGDELTVEWTIVLSES